MLRELSALVPKPRVNLTRFHGIFAPQKNAPAKPAYMPSMAITWAQRLSRVFNIDIEISEQCQGPVEAIACAEDPVAILHNKKGTLIV